MISLGREARGLNQADLAQALGVTQATISRYESGWVDVPQEQLRTLAIILRRPESFFSWDAKIYGASCLHHRRRQKISVRELKQIHAQVNILRIQAERLLRHTDVSSDYSFHRLDMIKLGGPEEVARRMRKLWQLPTGPMRSVIGAIESAGGIVFRCAFGSSLVDGISQWPLDGDLPPVFFVSSSSPGDRQRFTLAHEIGHVVMHHLPTDEPEIEANRFAGEILMPADEILPDLKDLTLQRAAALKSHWRVSMQAIIKWAQRLQAISVNQSEYLFRQMTARGYRLCEPVPLPAEEPELLPELIHFQRKSSGRQIKNISEEMGLLEEDFREIYLNHRPGLRLIG